MNSCVLCHFQRILVDCMDDCAKSRMEQIPVAYRIKREHVYFDAFYSYYLSVKKFYEPLDFNEKCIGFIYLSKVNLGTKKRPEICNTYRVVYFDSIKFSNSKLTFTINGNSKRFRVYNTLAWIVE